MVESLRITTRNDLLQGPNIRVLLKQRKWFIFLVADTQEIHHQLIVLHRWRCQFDEDRHAYSDAGSTTRGAIVGRINPSAGGAILAPGIPGDLIDVDPGIGAGGGEGGGFDGESSTINGKYWGWGFLGGIG